jgi:ribosomal protein S12 methylthiotransferase
MCAGEVMMGDVSRSGFQITDVHEDADAIIVNTCGFVEDAKAESIQTIIDASRLKTEGKVRRVIVTGCLAQRYAGELAEELPEADLVIGFQNYGSLSASLKGVLGLPPDLDEDEAVDGVQNLAGAVSASAPARVQVGGATVDFRPEWDRHRMTPAHTAYLRVAEGCNHACTFCAIPGFRWVV